MDFIHIEGFCNISAKISNQLNIDILQIEWLPELFNMRVFFFQLSSECLKS